MALQREKWPFGRLAIVEQEVREAVPIAANANPGLLCWLRSGIDRRGFVKLKNVILWCAFIGLLLANVSPSLAQFPKMPTVPRAMLNSPALRPPVGSKVAIVEFDDLECPTCAAWNPILMQAAAKYHVAWVRHDFLISYHVWSKQAAVNARWFDSKSAQLGWAYRNYIFTQQPNIATVSDLRDYTGRFAQAHGIAMPFVIDPQDKLLGRVLDDCALAQKLGIHGTPTVWVVTSCTHETGYPIARVQDANLLYAYLDQAVSAVKEEEGATRRR
jgi:predicted DsbA family dithiol-disulfide isomerase